MVVENRIVFWRWT